MVFVQTARSHPSISEADNFKTVAHFALVCLLNASAPRFLKLSQTKYFFSQLTPACGVRSEERAEHPNEALVMTGNIDIADELETWGFDFVVVG